MAKRKVDLEWNVILVDLNSRKIKNYNVLYSYNEDIYKEYTKGKIKTLEELKNYLKLTLQRQYWARFEYEIAVGGLSSKYPEEYEKIDAFRQISMNLDRITEYVNWKMQLNLK